MGEIVPVVFGILLGALVVRFHGAAKAVVLACGSIVGAVAAGLINGELAESLGFLLVDIPIIAVVAVAVAWMIARRPLAPAPRA